MADMRWCYASNVDKLVQAALDTAQMVVGVTDYLRFSNGVDYALEDWDDRAAAMTHGGASPGVHQEAKAALYLVSARTKAQAFTGAPACFWPTPDHFRGVPIQVIGETIRVRVDLATIKDRNRLLVLAVE